MSETSPFSFSEAPASVNIKAISPTGYDVMLTLRSTDGAELMPRALKALEWLAAQGFTPTTQRQAPASTNGSGAPMCQYHGPMKRSKKFDGWYCTAKMGDGSYCKEKVED